MKMFANFCKFLGLVILFVIDNPMNSNCQKMSEIPNEKISQASNPNSLNEKRENNDITCKGKKCFAYWMAVMGEMQEELKDSQAIIVKDEDVKGKCGKADRTSNNRYLMCAGSILNRNHILTSATCIHIATHIRHNIQGSLSVAIAPLKPSMQVVKVMEYQINPAHDTNPYSDKHLIHNLAILKLACRIDMENFHKVELPQAPFVEVCSEENCVVAIYRKLLRTRWAMRQAPAPNIPLFSRRKRATLLREEGHQETTAFEQNESSKNGKIRSKRKLADPPFFIGRLKSKNKLAKSKSTSRTSTTIETKENLNIDQTTTSFGSSKNSSSPEPMIFQDEYEYTDWSKPMKKKTIRRVVRSSDGHRGCPQTGTAVMLKKTQSAVVTAPCDDRQPSKKWGYTDVYDNLDWIHDTLQDKAGGGNGSSSQNPGSFGSCSTCIFNFFIEMGCKDKNGCGNKSIIIDTNRPQDPRYFGNSLSPVNPKDCLGSNAVGIGNGNDRECEKIKRAMDNTANYRRNWEKSLKPEIFDSSRSKNTPYPGNDDAPKPRRPIESVKINSNKDQRRNKFKYLRKYNPRVPPNPRRILGRASATSRNDKSLKIDDKHSDGVSNEIGLQNIEGDSNNRRYNNGQGLLK